MNRFELAALAAAWALALTGAAGAQDSLRGALRDRQVDELWVYDDWAAARELAAKEGKPLFVVFRCVP
jgi:hypothetical protein